MEKNSHDLAFKPNQFHLPSHITQIVLVTALPDDCTGCLYAFQKNDTHWEEIFHSIPVVIGRSGMAADKHEDDGKSPIGCHKIGYAFGIDSKPDYLRFPYKRIESADKFIDDVESPEYNQWIRGDTDAKRYERMKRKDHLYDLGMVLEYNMHPVVPGKGSAIFIHLWRNSRRGTDGCVAMARPDLENLMEWLDPEHNPHLYILES